MAVGVSGPRELAEGVDHVAPGRAGAQAERGQRPQPNRVGASYLRHTALRRSKGQLIAIPGSTEKKLGDVERNRLRALVRTRHAKTDLGVAEREEALQASIADRPSFGIERPKALGTKSARSESRT